MRGTFLKLISSTVTFARRLVLAAKREEIDWVHSEGVYEIVPMHKGKNVGMKPLDPILEGHRQVCRSVCEVVCKRIQNEEVRCDPTSSTRFSVVLCSVTS